MGCFNKIGFVSSLPILYGDECVLIFMEETHGYKSDKIGGVTYPYDLFKPIFLPIFGNYDDYGRIEYVKDTESVKFIEDFFGMTIDDIINDVDDNAVGRGSKKTAPKNDETFQKMTYGLEHKSYYDKMVAEFKPNKMTDSILSDIKRSGRETRMDGKGFSDDDFGKFLAERTGIEYVHPLDKLIEKVGEEPVLSMYAFNIAMMVLNSKYFPSNYGNQSQDFALHYKLLTLSRNIVVNKLAEYDEDGEIINSLREEIRDEQLTNLLRK